ncbi:MAG: SDR family oxidoreductase [Anderseniella sp.]|jgi:3-oxoacyl-[acyl-carrier protein] reductase|nr:SDR family oxidoreductase [Anderseniella sp.]
MDLGIAGKNAIVCASSRGLGRACAISLSRAGAHVTINGRNEEKLKEAADLCMAAGARGVNIVNADVSTPEGQDRLMNACPECDILINNNGGPPLKDFRELGREAILSGVEQNMVTPIELIQRVLPGMQARKFGRILNITSSSVKSPILGLDLSSGARAGLTAFLAGPARAVAGDNITINCILPGMFDTDRLKGSTVTQAKLKGVSVEEMEAMRTQSVPAKRFGTPEEFGELAAFLCSAQAGYITGQSILIDGGMFNASI